MDISALSVVKNYPKSKVVFTTRWTSTTRRPLRCRVRVRHPAGNSTCSGGCTVWWCRNSSPAAEIVSTGSSGKPGCVRSWRRIRGTVWYLSLPKYRSALSPLRLRATTRSKPFSWYRNTDPLPGGRSRRQRVPPGPTYLFPAKQLHFGLGQRSHCRL